MSIDISKISMKYESNGKWDAISNIPNDPGGASYGPWQLASKTNTLSAFLKASKYYLQFAGIKPGTVAFDNKWKLMTADQVFRDAQLKFIIDTHFMPVAKYYDSLQLHRCAMLDSALFSMSVQHSFNGNKKIIDAAEAALPNNYDDEDIIKLLYKYRIDYIDKLNINDNIKSALHNRYINEIKDVLNIKDNK